LPKDLARERIDQTPLGELIARLAQLFQQDGDLAFQLGDVEGVLGAVGI
jgi:hypothetical protein